MEIGDSMKALRDLVTFSYFWQGKPFPIIMDEFFEILQMAFDPPYLIFVEIHVVLPGDIIK